MLGKPHRLAGDVGSLTDPWCALSSLRFRCLSSVPEQGEEAASQQKGPPSIIIP